MAVTVARLQSVLTAITSDHDRALGKSESKMKSVAKAAGITGAAVVGGLAVGLKSAVGAAQEAEKAQITLEQALRSANVSYRDHGKEIDAAIQKTSRLAALDDEDLSNAFAKLVRSTGDVKKSMEGMNLAADIARTRGVSLESATKAVERAFLGSDTALKRYGVSVPKVTDAVDKLKEMKRQLRESLQGATEAQKEEIKETLLSIEGQMRAAKEIDKRKTGLAAIEEAQRQFADGAKRYGESSAAASERFGVAVENLQESIGQHLLPIMTKLMTAATNFIYWIEQNWPRFKTIVLNTWQAMKPTFDSLVSIVMTIADTVEKHWGTIERNFNALKTVVVDALKIIRDAIQLVNALLHGEWGEAWKNAKEIVASVIDAIKTLLANQLENIRQLAFALGRAFLNAFKEGVTGVGEFFLGVLTGLKDMLVNQLANIKSSAVRLGDAIKDGIVEGITGLGQAIWGLIKAIPGFLLDQIRASVGNWVAIGDAIKDAIVDGLSNLGDAVWDKVKGGITSLPGRITGAITGSGDWKGLDTPGGGNFPTTAAPGNFNLMGALPQMAPFAAAAAAHGLVVSSGLRPGARTKHGTLSDHAIGKALDVAGPASGMAGFFRSLIGNPNVKQAFYDPLGSIFGGIRNSYREGGHSDHVHVATYDRGGSLMPGWNIAYNGTGRPEPVGGNVVIPVSIGGEHVATVMFDLLRRKAQVFERQNGRPAFGGGF